MMERKITVGKHYRHFKGIIVEVVALAKNSEDLSDVVVYKHDSIYWTRPKIEFLSEVDHKKYPNIAQKYRFEEIDE